MSATQNTRPSGGWRVAAMLAFVAGGFLASIGARADNSIDSVAVSRGSTGRTVVKMTLKEPMGTPPAGFSINNPPRIALDFPATANGT